MTVFGIIRYIFKLLVLITYLTTEEDEGVLFWIIINLGTKYFLLKKYNILFILQCIDVLRNLRFKLTDYLKEKCEVILNTVKTSLTKEITSYRFQRWVNPVVYFFTESTREGSNTDDSDDENTPDTETKREKNEEKGEENLDESEKASTDLEMNTDISEEGSTSDLTSVIKTPQKRKGKYEEKNMKRTKSTEIDYFENTPSFQLESEAKNDEGSRKLFSSPRSFVSKGDRIPAVLRSPWRDSTFKTLTGDESEQLSMKSTSNSADEKCQISQTKGGDTCQNESEIFARTTVGLPNVKENSRPEDKVKSDCIENYEMFVMESGVKFVDSIQNPEETEKCVGRGKSHDHIPVTADDSDIRIDEFQTTEARETRERIDTLAETVKIASRDNDCSLEQVSSSQLSKTSDSTSQEIFPLEKTDQTSVNFENSLAHKTFHRSASSENYQTGSENTFQSAPGSLILEGQQFPVTPCRNLYRDDCNLQETSNIPSSQGYIDRPFSECLIALAKFRTCKVSPRKSRSRDPRYKTERNLHTPSSQTSSDKGNILQQKFIENNEGGCEISEILKPARKILFQNKVEYSSSNKRDLGFGNTTIQSPAEPETPSDFVQHSNDSRNLSKRHKCEDSKVDSKAEDGSKKEDAKKNKNEASREVTQFRTYPGFALRPLKVKKDSRYQKKFYRQKREVRLPVKLEKVIRWLKKHSEYNSSESEDSDDNLTSDQYHELVKDLTQGLLAVYKNAKKDKVKIREEKKLRRQRKMIDYENKSCREYVESSFKEESPPASDVSDDSSSSILQESPVKSSPSKASLSRPPSASNLSMVTVSPDKTIARDQRVLPRSRNWNPIPFNLDDCQSEITQFSVECSTSPQSISVIRDDYNYPLQRVVVKRFNTSDPEYHERIIFCREQEDRKKPEDRNTLRILKPLVEIKTFLNRVYSHSVEEFLVDLRSLEQIYRDAMQLNGLETLQFESTLTICIIPFRLAESEDELDGDTWMQDDASCSEVGHTSTPLSSGLEVVNPDRVLPDEIKPREITISVEKNESESFLVKSLCQDDKHISSSQMPSTGTQPEEKHSNVPECQLHTSPISSDTESGSEIQVETKDSLPYLETPSLGERAILKDLGVISFQSSDMNYTEMEKEQWAIWESFREVRSGDSKNSSLSRKYGETSKEIKSNSESQSSFDVTSADELRTCDNVLEIGKESSNRDLSNSEGCQRKEYVTGNSKSVVQTKGTWTPPRLREFLNSITSKNEEKSRSVSSGEKTNLDENEPIGTSGKSSLSQTEILPGSEVLQLSVDFKDEDTVSSSKASFENESENTEDTNIPPKGTDIGETPPDSPK